MLFSGQTSVKTILMIIIIYYNNKRNDNFNKVAYIIMMPINFNGYLSMTVSYVYSYA